MRSYDITEWGRPLQVVLRDTPAPRGTQVRVKVQACGVCHSDLHIQHGALDLGNGQSVSFESVGVHLPFTMGHEIVGVVDAVGTDATIAVGTKCVVYPWHGCGECFNCRNRREVDCESGRALGTRKPGGYADYVMVPHSCYLLDYGTLNPLFAATCACSGLTAFSALLKLPTLLEDDALVLVGAGGLGLAAVAIAGMLTEAKIIVADIDDAKLEEAKQAGADAVLNTRSPEALIELRKLAPNGVRAVVDFVGSGTTTEMAMKAVSRGGTVIVVGLFGGAFTISTALLPMRNVTLRGSYVGSLDEMESLLKLMQKSKPPFLPVRLHARPMSSINDALSELSEGRILGRVIAVNEA
ncbi:alcohol dehydrogenase [Burkholderia plantarii]|uniref:alcohol dehydrogenase n=1 Tax=Burkholderia plantarii TaxID=41899 RepID=UPI000706D73E|nr:alcohol dehydrogenase [Burkholderia plantarii]ALK35265.1 Zn-dependent alcohol dehydrogenase [Burkholderia plantarii]WLE64226.1 alcohol dehydrogenase catalytic domain-containing protein [Burkholderia plantarii]GLZ23242.1 NAD-dependent alcohol dehydrogenase [Burkholderia plantarii]